MEERQYEHSGSIKSPGVSIHSDQSLSMHLICLYLTCIDLLEGGEFVTYREKDISLPMSIHNGKYQKEDRTYEQEFFDMVSDLGEWMQYAKEHTVPIPKPNYKRIGEFVLYVNS